MSNNALMPLEPRDLTELQNVAQVFAQSGMFPDARQTAQAFVKIMAGREIGLGAFAAMQSIHIIEGKPAFGANAMALAVKRSGKYDYRVEVLSDDECVITFYERGESLGSSSITMHEVEAAGYNRGKDGSVKKNWRQFPRNMLFARAISNGVRWYCPDVFNMAVYTPDEMTDEAPPESEIVDYNPDTGEVVIVDAPPVEQPRIITSAPNNPRRVQTSRTVPPQTAQEGQHAQEGAQQVKPEPAANGGNGPVSHQGGQGAKWAQEKRNIRALMGKAEILWAEENLPAPRIINRMARAWGLNGTASSDFNRLCELAAAQVTFSQDDAWKRIQTYTPDSDTSDEPPMCECGKGTPSGEGPYPELCIRCANERANAEAASQ